MHLIGNDPRSWRIGVASYGRVEYRSVYPGIDVVYYGNQRQLEYDFLIEPGASPSAIAFEIDGAQKVEIAPDGSLVLTAAAGALTHRAPILYQHDSGSRRPVEGRYVMRSDGRIGFHVGRYDESLPLVIDPVLSYSSYFGGSMQERIHGVTSDADGHIIVAGETYSPDFPTANPMQPQRNGLGEAFVAKLAPAGDALVYATFLGGSHEDSATAVEVDAAGAAYVVGSTMSWDFPTLNAFQPANNGTFDAFVVKLDQNGGLTYSTFLGGGFEDYAAGIAVDADGRAHVAGATGSANFPTVNGLQSSLGGHPVYRTTDGGDTWNGQKNGLRTTAVWSFAFDPGTPETVYAGTDQGVFKTTDAGTTWSAAGGEMLPWQVTSVAIGYGASPAVYAATSAGVYRSSDGGESWSQLQLAGSVYALAVPQAAPGTIYAGVTSGSPGVFKSTDGGDTWTETGLNAPVQALAVSGSVVYASTPNGVFTSNAGEGWVLANNGLPSEALSLAVDPANPSNAYAGTFNGLFRTTNGGGSWEQNPIFVGVPIFTVALAPSDPSTVFVTTFWGSAVSNDAGENWRPTHSDRVIASAIAVHPSIPTIAYIGVQMNRDGFVATLSADGSSLEYSTYYGGSDHDDITDIALDVNGGRYVVGQTASADLQVLNAVQATHGGLQDAFAARIGNDGLLAYSTFLGGFGFESTPKVAVDSLGQVHVAGLTWSTGFPVVNAHQPQLGGGYMDMFVSVLNAAGNGFVYSTYLGGDNLETNSGQSLGPDVIVSAAGDTYVTGTTMSHDFPTTSDAFQPVHGGGQNDATLTRFDAAGNLRYSTFLGGSGDDYSRSLARGAGDSVIVTGYTSSTDFPVRDAIQPASAGSDDGFIARISGEAGPPDTEPPVTTIAVTGTAGLAGWYRSPVVVTLTASDGIGSGVALVEYSLNGGAWHSYTGPFTVSAQGSTQVIGRATDVAGNVADPTPPTTVMVDSVAPAVAIASPEPRDYLYTQTIALSTSVSDAVSGVAGSPAVTLDGAAFTGTTIDLSTLGLGPHTVVVSAADVAGNPSQASVTFRVVAVNDGVIHVPAEASTIQGAISLAVNGDTVLVAPGTYVETINFQGKAIAVTSVQGPEQTIIDARGAGSVVTFQSGETRASILSGFTILGGFNTYSGGGIYIASASPTIRGNVITDNRSCTGVGIYSSFGSPLIENNRITRNRIQGCAGGWGIGVYIGGNSAAQVIGNEISENTGAAASGGGVALFAAGSAVVRGNVIARNATSGAAGCGWGGGIASANFSEAQVVNNLVVGNSACFGGGIHWRGSTGGAFLVNNTVAENEATASSPGVYLSGFGSLNQLHNNIIVVRSGPALYCENTASVPPVLQSNDIFSADGAAYGGTCADRTGIDGNVSGDPGFLNTGNGDYRVHAASPVVDAGNDSAPHLPSLDAAGQSRTVDGNGDGVARVDIGALEYRNRAPIADAGPDQSVAAGSDCRAQVTLTGSATDADGDAVTLVWSGSFGTSSGPTLTLTLPVGTHVMTLTATDANGGSGTDTVVVVVVDTAPPTIASVTATPSVLTKSNHEMIPVIVAVSATDLCSGPVDCQIVSVTSNEPVSGTGGGDKSPDWEITGSLTLNLRAERTVKGTGRIYTITVRCTDSAGNQATSTVTVTVPR